MKDNIITEALSHRTTILHVDLDAFFVEVELLHRPELRGKPVIIGWSSPRGVVSTCSYEARKFGVRSAMPSVVAQRLCPHAVWLPSNHSDYIEYSRRVFSIFHRYSPDVIQCSIDEGRIDLTGCEPLFGPSIDIAHRILNDIRTEVGLPASAGLANSGVVAKIAAEFAKPSGLVCIMEGYEKQFLASFPVERIPGVGTQSLPRFHTNGIYTIGDITRKSPEELSLIFGRWAHFLHHVANGIPERNTHSEPVSVSRSSEETFEHDLVSPDEIRSVLRRIVEKLGFRLRRSNLCGKTITVKIRDGHFNTITRSITLSTPMNSDHILFHEACRMVFANLPQKTGVRLLGVSVHHLQSENRQLELFASPGSRSNAFFHAVDRIKERFGYDSAGFGTLVKH